MIPTAGVPILAMAFSLRLIPLLLALSILACIGLGVYLIAAPTDSVAGVAMNRVFAITFGALLILFGLLITIGVCCYRKRIKLASIIVQTSARFVK